MTTTRTDFIVLKYSVKLNLPKNYTFIENASKGYIYMISDYARVFMISSESLRIDQAYSERPC